MGSVNRAYLRNLARLYADGRPGGTGTFVEDSDATANAVSFDTLINGALAELYDVLVAARGHEYYATDAILDLANGGVRTGVSLYPLPTDFYELLSIRLEWDPYFIEELHPMGVRERSRYESLAYNIFERGTPKAYRLQGTQTASARTVEILPVPTRAVTCRIRYIPLFANLADDAALFDGVNGWEKLVALKAAIEYRTIAEKPLGNLAQLYAECFARINALADQRNANYAEQIQQVNPERWRRGGMIGGLGSGSGIFDDSFDDSFN
jgi:hypothetical protein